MLNFVLAIGVAAMLLGISAYVMWCNENIPLRIFAGIVYAICLLCMAALATLQVICILPVHLLISADNAVDRELELELVLTFPVTVATTLAGCHLAVWHLLRNARQ